jgi:DcuC family C4-dicarboxylate transporter
VSPSLLAATLIVAGAVALMVRRVEVRLVLMGAGLALALVAGRPLTIADVFTRAMVAGMVAPICAAMGFASLMTATRCDLHLVRLLLAPLRRVRFLLLPGGILVAYLVNMAVPSQTSTAAALGPILVPLLLSAGYAPGVAGAALLLGASFGGDLLNPGAQDIQAIAGAVGLSAPQLSARVIPASVAGALVAAVAFALANRGARDGGGAPLVAAPSPDDALRLDPVRALVPLLPILLLLAAYGGWTPLGWLLAVPPGEEWQPLANALPVVRAMLIGALVACVVAFREVQALTRAFFDGMGTGYGSIISLTITAQCFGAGIAAVGMSDALLGLAHATGALSALSAGFPWLLAMLSGSGSGPILAFAQAFLTQIPADQDAVRLAALACFGGAFGRTASPVAAVVVYSSGLTGVSPVELVRRVFPPLVAGAAVSLAVAAR